jgi:segregation and condensation protein B
MEGDFSTMDARTESREESEQIETLDGEATRDDPSGGDDQCPEIRPRQVVEAILMASDAPLSAAKIAAILEVGTARDVRGHIDELNEQYKSAGMSFHVEHIAGGYQILTLPEFNHWLGKLLQVRQETRLSPAAMETLAIVAYKQPCTRADVEAIRGVAVGERLQKLREMNLVKIVGRAEDLGRPMLYGTTRRFLQTFGLGSLDDLPQVQALRPPSAATELPADEQAASISDTPIASDDHDVNGNVVEEERAATSNLSIVREDSEPSP